MSVFIRDDTKRGVYSYDFQLRGHRFSGSTGKTTKREALEVEKRIREEKKAELARDAAAFSESPTIEAAAARYWEEVGKFHTDSDGTLRSLDWLVNHFGRNTMLRDITSSDIARMVAKRRGEFVPDQRKKKPKDDDRQPRLVSNRTVNLTATVPLRQLCLRARKVWKIAAPDIVWKDHLLKERQERIREASIDEEAAIMSQLDRGYDDAIRFAFLTGCRRMEILGLEWTDIDFFSRRFVVRGKRDRTRTIPMSQPIYDLLWSQKDNHATKVFTYEARRTTRHNDIVRDRGKRYPLTDTGLKSAMRRAVPKGGVANFRFHDMRHTAATRTLRKSNLRVVQNLLGHTEIATTAKYAHALIDDIQNALDATHEVSIQSAEKTGRNSR